MIGGGGRAVMKFVGQLGRLKTQAGAEVENILEAEFLHGKHKVWA